MEKDWDGLLNSMAISGTDLLEVPTIYKAYVRGYPHKIWPYMVQYLHFRILKLPLINCLVHIIQVHRFLAADVQLQVLHGQRAIALRVTRNDSQLLRF